MDRPEDLQEELIAAGDPEIGVHADDCHGVDHLSLCRPHRHPRGALVWHRNSLRGDEHIFPGKGFWCWKNAHPAKALRRPILEAQERGALTGVTMDFTATHDSGDVRWSSNFARRLTFSIGDTLLEVVQQIRAMDFEITMDAGTNVHTWTSGSAIAENRMSLFETTG